MIVNMASATYLRHRSNSTISMRTEFLVGTTLQRHHFLDFVVDAFSPLIPLFWRRASTFCKAPLKKSTSIVLSASSRFSWLTSLRSVDSREFPGDDSSPGSKG